MGITDGACVLLHSTSSFSHSTRLLLVRPLAQTCRNEIAIYACGERTNERTIEPRQAMLESRASTFNAS